MRIVLVTPELAPLSDGTGAGSDVAALGAALCDHGHDAHAIMPLASEIDPGAHSLARRLKPITVEVDGQQTKWGRFDGRTPQGIEVHLLGMEPPPEGPADHRFWRAFSAAAAEMLASLQATDTCCLACDPSCASVAAFDRAGAGAARVHLLSLAALDDQTQLLEEDLVHLDRIALVGEIADRCRKSGPASLSDRLAKGAAVPLPQGVSKRDPISPNDKASAKVGLQTSVGLPVRPQVPLISFVDGNADLLRRALSRGLRGDVQAIAFGDDGSGPLADLAERYPDRLALVPSDVEPLQSLIGADACVVFDDARLPAQALASGTVPVADHRLGTDIVDLNPELTSGSAVLFDREVPETIDEALDRVVTAHRTGRPFEELAQRIQGYATPWPMVADFYLQLIQQA